MVSRLRRAWVLGLVALSACVDHPVGPARTFDDYQRKARTSAESVVSAIESARLVASAASRGKALAGYTVAVITEAEGTASGVQGTFESIQPPDRRADDLRTELDDLLSEAAGHLSDLRIAARRGELSRLADEARPLDDDADALRDFIEANE